MKISSKTIEEIYAAAIIEDVIADFVVLKKAGANYKGLSPFNDEKTPSFVVSPVKEIWKDFSSGKGGNLISFLMEHEQYSYPEALLYLAKKYSINVEYEELKPEDQKKESERESLLIVLNFAKEIFAKNLAGLDKKALNYLKDRGFSNEIIEEFEIGFCPEGDVRLLEETKKSGYNIQYLEKTRIIQNNNNRFNNRLIFPIHSISGQVLGFGARILEENTKKAKYLNSDSSEIYQKSKVLYGLHLAKKHIKNSDFCYIVEGYTDVMALSQSGIKNVVSNCGTALTKEQIRLIKRFTNNIVILFDSDLAGVNATIKAIDSILEQNMSPKILQLPNHEDPASFIKNNKVEFVKEYLVDNTVDFIDFKYNLSNSTDSSALIRITKEIIQSISLIEDKISKNIHVRRAAKVLGIPESDILHELSNAQKFIKKISKASKLKTQEDNLRFSLSDFKKNSLEEFQLIRLLINYGTEFQMNQKENLTLAHFIVSELDKDDIGFTVPLFKDIFHDVKLQINHKKNISRNYFLSHKNQHIRELSGHIIGDAHILGNWQQKDIVVLEEKDKLLAIATESILRFKLKRVQEMVKKSLSRLKNPEIEDESDLVHFSRLSNLEKKIQQELGRIF